MTFLLVIAPFYDFLPFRIFIIFYNFTDDDSYSYFLHTIHPLYIYPHAVFTFLHLSLFSHNSSYCIHHLFLLIHHCTNSLSSLHIFVHHCTFCASLHTKTSSVAKCKMAGAPLPLVCLATSPFNVQIGCIIVRDYLNEHSKDRATRTILTKQVFYTDALFTNPSDLNRSS